MRYTVIANSSHLLTIFASMQLELPFRFQPVVKIVIPFEEYADFVREVMRKDIHCFRLGRELYIRALSQSSGLLLRKLYYFDISDIVLAEVMLAHLNNDSGATVFCHQYSDIKTVYSLDYNMLSERMNAVPKDIFSKALNSIKNEFVPGFSTRDLNRHNKCLFYYSVLLKCMSFTNNPELFNIIEEKEL